MAVRTSLTWIKRRFSRAIRQLADRELWSRNRYEFTGTFDASIGRFSLVFGYDYNLLNEGELYKKIRKAIQDEFQDHPAIGMNVSLVIQKVDPGHLEEVYQELMIGEDDVDLGDLLA